MRFRGKGGDDHAQFVRLFAHDFWHFLLHEFDHFAFLEFGAAEKLAAVDLVLVEKRFQPGATGKALQI